MQSAPPSPEAGVPVAVPAELGRLLRRAVLEHARGERRRVHLPLVHVGVPGGAERVLAVRPEDRLDHALRADAVAAMRAATRRALGSEPLVWLTRTGPLELQDVDAAWLAAARTAYAEADAVLVMVVVNRRGWWDPRSGAGRTWQRLRER
ncbi:hypothetical protein QWY28_09230 [Nocardioides sp. SOB77]|uniref:Uncharacterized protein n=1 Tax=Nocardioides oceani TaxID=3058369 RepID=A0ABT8FEN6_9ACTN|nr:hypothetical protein [Nocardioides oceani]MDN4173122.1 hypothetical protein [Nocardioides oceani]